MTHKLSTIVVNHSTASYEDAERSDVKVDPNEYDDDINHMTVGQRIVIHDTSAESGYGFLQRTHDGYETFKLKYNQLPFMLKGGFGGNKKS